MPKFKKVNGLDFPFDPITSRHTLNNKSPSFNENSSKEEERSVSAGADPYAAFYFV